MALCVYELHPEDLDEERWVLFKPSGGKCLPWTFADEAAFFDANPELPIERDEELTPRRKRTRLGDCSSLGKLSFPVLSDRARQVLEPLMPDVGRWIPLPNPEGVYWGVYITRIIDVLDVERSDVRYFKAGEPGRVKHIARYEFIPERVADEWMFRVATRPDCAMVTQHFVDAVEQHGLTGFRFKPIWTGEAK